MTKSSNGHITVKRDGRSISKLAISRVRAGWPDCRNRAAAAGRRDLFDDDQEKDMKIFPSVMALFTFAVAANAINDADLPISPRHGPRLNATIAFAGDGRADASGAEEFVGYLSVDQFDRVICLRGPAVRHPFRIGVQPGIGINTDRMTDRSMDW
jgi:hypothetical protein